ncbi:hypothetical protein BCR36DRAFT_168973, partial [Piromyces finnis]
KLQGSSNFDIWYCTIEGYLKAKQLGGYIKSNYKTFNEPSKFEPNDALAGIIIFTNCTDSVKRYIMNCESAYEKMEKLKSLYKLDDTSNHGEWLRR